MKTYQNKLDDEAVKGSKATGADQRGGQDKLDPPRLKPSELTPTGEIATGLRKAIVTVRIRREKE